MNEDMGIIFRDEITGKAHVALVTGADDYLKLRKTTAQPIGMLIKVGPDAWHYASDDHKTAVILRGMRTVMDFADTL